MTEIKIDKSFVLGMCADPKDAEIVRLINDLGHTLGLRVVAEGVETAAALEHLTDMGCDVAQGYYLSRPLAGRRRRTVAARLALALVPRGVGHEGLTGEPRAARLRTRNTARDRARRFPTAKGARCRS